MYKLSGSHYDPEEERQMKGKQEGGKREEWGG